MIVASVALTPNRDPKITRTNMVRMIETIMQHHPDTDLVVFGEMIPGWYNPGGAPEYHQRISEVFQGDTTSALAPLAQKFKIFICFGISELDRGKIYNTQILLDTQGDIQAVHRKRNLKAGELTANYQPGSEMVTITNIKGVKTGIVICSDTASPQTMRELPRSKLDLIIHSLADDDQDDFVTCFQARMYDAWIVSANRYGTEGDQFWPGLITVTDPLGRIRCSKQGQEKYLVIEMRFATTSSWLQRTLRNIWVKTPLIFHVLRNWKRARSYL